MIWRYVLVRDGVEGGSGGRGGCREGGGGATEVNGWEGRTRAVA